MGIKTKIATGGLVLALGLVTLWEGYEEETYLDVVGIPTVCYGHTGSDVFMGDSKTLNECHELLAQDLKLAWTVVDKYVKPDLPANVHAAFTSFVFNVGAEAFRKSTALKLLNQGKIEEACHELPKWVYADGKKIKGLVNRRAAELKLCLGE